MEINQSYVELYSVNTNVFQLGHVLSDMEMLKEEGEKKARGRFQLGHVLSDMEMYIGGLADRAAAIRFQLGHVLSDMEICHPVRLIHDFRRFQLGHVLSDMEMLRVSSRCCSPGLFQLGHVLSDMEIGCHFGPVPAWDFISICEHLPFSPQNTS